MLNNETLETYKTIRALLKDDLEFVEDRIEYLESLGIQQCRMCNKGGAIYQCTCGQYLCSDKCIKEHTGDYTIEQMRKIEKHEIIENETRH